MKKVLILEDDLDLAMHWKALLESEGYHVFHEISVDPAIEALKNETIDLVVSDMLIGNQTIGFDNKGGLSLLSYISLYCTPRPKFIAVTGSFVNNALERHASMMKADLTLRKPISDDQLLQAIGTLLVNFRIERPVNNDTNSGNGNFVG